MTSKPCMPDQHPLHRRAVGIGKAGAGPNSAQRGQPAKAGKSAAAQPPTALAKTRALWLYKRKQNKAKRHMKITDSQRIQAQVMPKVPHQEQPVASRSQQAYPNDPSTSRPGVQHLFQMLNLRRTMESTRAVFETTDHRCIWRPDWRT